MACTGTSPEVLVTYITLYHLNLRLLFPTEKQARKYRRQQMLLLSQSRRYHNCCLGSLNSIQGHKPVYNISKRIHVCKFGIGNDIELTGNSMDRLHSLNLKCCFGNLPHHSRNGIDEYIGFHHKHHIKYKMTPLFYFPIEHALDEKVKERDMFLSDAFWN